MKKLYLLLMHSPSRKFYGLDHLRALAILMVLLYHYHMGIFGHPEWMNDIMKFGWTGVDLFFVLSGFLIASQLFAEVKERNHFSFGQFFLRRFFRIIPAFLAVLAIYFCIPAFHEKEALPPLWKFLSFAQNFGLNFLEEGTFSHAWSLCVEEHFYLLLPLALLVLLSAGLFRKAWVLLLLLFVLGFFLRHYSWVQCDFSETEDRESWERWYAYVYYPSYNRLDGLLTGMGIAALYTFRPAVWEKWTRAGNLLLLAGLLVLTGAYFLCEVEHSWPATVFGFPLVAIGYGLLLMGALSPACFLYKWNSKVTSFIAAVSFSLYLSHKGVIHVTQHLLPGIGADSNVMLLICICTCLAAAALLRWLVEKPFLELRTRTLKRTNRTGWPTF